MENWTDIFCTFDQHCSRSIILLCYFVLKIGSYLIHFQKIQCKRYHFLFKATKYSITDHCYILPQDKLVRWQYNPLPHMYDKLTNVSTLQSNYMLTHWDIPYLFPHSDVCKSNFKSLVSFMYRRFHGRGRHLGSGANPAKFTVNVWEKSWFWCSITWGRLIFWRFCELQTKDIS